MKKFGSIVLVMLVMSSILAGCGTAFDADENTVYVGKNGKIISVDLEIFEEGSYDESEIKEFVDDTVEAYNDTLGEKAVKVLDISFSGSTGKLKMQYENAEAYTDFYGIELYQGSVVQAMAAGYDFDTAFSGVEEGEITGTATKQDILNGDDLKVVVIQANINVKIDGTIVYVSGENVTVTGEDTVSIQEEGATDSSFETDVYTYIIYK